MFGKTAGFMKKINLLKLLLALFIPLIAITILYIFVILPSLRDDIYNEKMLHTMEMVDIGLSVLKHFYSLEQEGQLSREEAQAEAARLIRTMRYGEREIDYFWINDMHPRVIAHPFRPDLEGRDVSDFQDPQGFFLFREFVEICREQESGHVSYFWQYYDEADRFEEKLSFVACFEPWEWIIGTGVYLADLEAVIAVRRNLATGLMALFFAVTAALIVFYFKGKKVEREKLESEEMYRLIAENTADVITVFDFDLNIT